MDALDPSNVLLRLSEAPEPREVNTLVRAVNRALTRLDHTMAILRGFHRQRRARAENPPFNHAALVRQVATQPAA